MPRVPRIEFGGAIYHVMNRGDHLEVISKNEKHREVLIKTLEEACVSAGWKRMRSRVGMRWLAG